MILCGPMDCSLPGPSVHGISQARILERIAISSSRGSSKPTDHACISCASGITTRFFHWLATMEAPKSYNLVTKKLKITGGPVAKNLPANAGDIGLIPGPGRFHMPRGSLVCAAQLLSPHTLQPMLHNKRSQHPATRAQHSQK